MGFKQDWANPRYRIGWILRFTTLGIALIVVLWLLV